MVIVPALALAVLAFLMYQAVVGIRPAPVHPGTALENAIANTRERLSRGEIDRNDFDRIVSILTN